jgi:hypothetical protein
MISDLTAYSLDRLAESNNGTDVYEEAGTVWVRFSMVRGRCFALGRVGERLADEALQRHRERQAR